MSRSSAALIEPVEILRAPALGSVPHGFFGRRGGVSTGEVAGLQIGLGAGDDPAAVAENRRRALAALAGGAAAQADLVTLYQVHSPDVVRVTHAWTDAERPRADGMVTDQHGLVLGIVTADCAPVLLADAEAGVIGAAHAGWRGAHGGVLENIVAAMAGLGASPARIAAAVGPAIASESYEVDAPFRAHFAGEEARFFTPAPAERPGRLYFDLPAYVEARLAGAGVGRIDRLDLDTYAEPDRFYSFRRATHLREANYGRQFSLVALRL